MTTDATFEPAAPARFRLRFSLLALFVFVTLVCVLLASWVQPNRVVATALFRINRTPPTLLNGEFARASSEQDFEIVKKTQVALIKSDFVVESALRTPAISSLPILRSQKDPAAWLTDHLAIDFPEDAEILAIRLHGPEAHANDLAIIVDAVAKAYVNEVLFAERQRQQLLRDVLAMSLEKLQKEVANRWEDNLTIARETGHEDSAAGHVLQQIDLKRHDLVETELMRLEGEQLQLQADSNKGNSEFFDKRLAQLRAQREELVKRIMARNEIRVDLLLHKRELEQLQGIVDEMSAKLGRIDIESQSPPRIEQVQKAIVRPD